MEKDQKNIVDSRRNFVKKTIYVAPALMVLGSLNAHAKSTPDDSNLVVTPPSNGG